MTKFKLMLNNETAAIIPIFFVFISFIFIRFQNSLTSKIVNATEINKLHKFKKI